MDTETRSFLQERVAAEAGLPGTWADRVEGADVAGMRADAARLAQVLGISEPENARDAQGRFVGVDDADRMNAEIRAATGTRIVAPPREREPEGTLGAGHGGLPNPQPPNMTSLEG